MVMEFLLYYKSFGVMFENNHLKRIIDEYDCIHRVWMTNVDTRGGKGSISKKIQKQIAFFVFSFLLSTSVSLCHHGFSSQLSAGRISGHANAVYQVPVPSLSIK